MKNVLKTAVAGAVAAAFVASVAVAQQTTGQRQGRAPGMGPGGPGARAFGAAVMKDLTDQQRQQIRAIHEEFRVEDRADAKLRQQLELELLADSPNTGKIEELKQQILAAHSEALTKHITVRTKIAQQVLTAEQRAKAREQVTTGPGERGPRGRRGAGGPRRQ